MTAITMAITTHTTMINCIHSQKRGSSPIPAEDRDQLLLNDGLPQRDRDGVRAGVGLEL